MNRAFATYDETGGSGNIQAAMQAAEKETAKALEFAKEAIDLYAADCRNRGDLGVVAQLNYQFFNVLRQLDATFRLNSPFQMVDDAGFRLASRVRIDMTKPWKARDGKASVQVISAESDPVQQISLGGANKYNSVWVSRAPVNVADAPILDMCLRSTSSHPIRLMFQVPGNETWYGIDLIGTQKIGKTLDGIKAVHRVNDGQWHRVNFNLRQMIAEQIDTGITNISNLIIGTWVESTEPAIIGLRRVAFGIDNRLDGQEK